MKADQIACELRDFIHERFGVPANDPDFADDLNLFDFGYIDSMGAVVLTNFVENHFRIQVTDSDWVTYPLNSIREIASFVAQRHGGS